MIKILIVDDHPIFREGLSKVLNDEPEFEVCAEAGSRNQAIEAIVRHHPDVCLIDLTLEHSSGLDLTKDIRARWKNLPILILSNHEEGIYAERCIRAGANGYLMKHNPPQELIQAIGNVVTGNIVLSQTMTGHLLHRATGKSRALARDISEELSDRELQVFELYGNGHSTRNIADQLHISIKTVETHREHIKSKLKLKDTNQLLRAAVQWNQSQAGFNPTAKSGLDQYSIPFRSESEARR